MLLAFSYLSQAQDHSAEVSKAGEDKTSYTVLSFYYIMEYMYLYIFKHYFSTVFDPSELCTAAFQAARANPL